MAGSFRPRRTPITMISIKNMISIKTLFLGGALLAAPLLVSATAQAEHGKTLRYRPSYQSFPHRYIPSYRSGSFHRYVPSYQRGTLGSSSRVHGRSHLRHDKSHLRHGRPHGHRAVHRHHGFRASQRFSHGRRGSAIGARGFSLYNGR